jgi:hypothetical protein
MIAATWGVRRRVLGLVGAACAAIVPACGAQPLVLPQPPQDLTSLAQAYASPTGTVDAAHLQQVVADAQARFYGSNLDWLPPLVSDELVRLRRRFDDQSFPFDPLSTHQKNRPALQAVITADHTCQGWTDTPGPPDQAANGSLDLTAVIDDSQLRRGIWGNGVSCQERVQALNRVGVNTFLSGTVGVLLQGPLPADDQKTLALVQVSGQIGTDAQVTSGTFDFAIVGPNVEFRYPVSDGDVIVSIGTLAISVRGKNGTFTCDLSGQSCSAQP